MLIQIKPYLNTELYAFKEVTLVQLKAKSLSLFSDNKEDETFYYSLILGQIHYLHYIVAQNPGLNKNKRQMKASRDISRISKY